MFGQKQIDWLKDSLISSRANFKIVANGSQMMNRIAPDEGLADFPDEQQELIDFIREYKIEGIIFLSGDRHFSELVKRTEDGLYPLYDFTSSPLTSGPNNSKNAQKSPDRVPGTFVSTVRNFGLIEGTGAGKDRRLILKILDYTGKEWWSYEIKKDDLKFANKQN